jgi:hypothetical protein
MSGNYDDIARDIRSTRESLASQVAVAIEEFLKRELGIWLTDSQRDKLHDFTEIEGIR